MYRIRFERRARQQLDQCCSDYGDEVCGELWTWLERLAEAAEANTLEGCSADFLLFLEELAGEIEQGDLAFSLQTWKRKDWLTKLKALITLIRGRKPPWQLRHASELVRVFSQSVEVYVICEIDHVNRSLIVRKFVDLPGQ